MKAMELVQQAKDDETAAAIKAAATTTTATAVMETEEETTRTNHKHTKTSKLDNNNVTQIFTNDNQDVKNSVIK